ncbi:hypothetical protein GGS23DRAFT_548264 [Durotheca rogersii]|uniref:uncharacterized protein n=1 Tax=Durotheca rogersii TaxID=419775 RepID=UPI00221FBC99|nr:uncharacterized protein GGS23DRAFT_548264 [Durotheca rogersii]KAI5867410.1 hypothetical protein GGS23DRAFT_548264 [Durotheca rogersii]
MGTHIYIYYTGIIYLLGSRILACSSANTYVYCKCSVPTQVCPNVEMDPSHLKTTPLSGHLQHLSQRCLETSQGRYPRGHQLARQLPRVPGSDEASLICPCRNLHVHSHCRNPSDNNLVSPTYVYTTYMGRLAKGVFKTLSLSISRAPLAIGVTYVSMRCGYPPYWIAGRLGWTRWPVAMPSR